MIVAGIDEAGLGPALGPLCTCGAAFRLPDGAGPDAPWEIFSALLSRHCRGALPAVADSKAVYAARGLAGLELPVLAFLQAQRRGAALPPDRATFLRALGCPLPSADLTPWEPFHVSLGFDAADSTVMIDEVLHVDGDWPFEIGRMPSCTWTYGWKNDLDMMADRAIGGTPSILENAAKKEHNIHKLSTQEIDAFRLISHRNYILVVYPGQARELAEKGFTRESLARYIADYNRYPWDELGEELQASVLKVAKSGEIPGLTEDDCKPGGTIPVFDP
ncbi:MAG: hypothetical protein J6333_04930, partial [Planctomycetes bacterium]|nr:hypothetical protein [Planctomycetota bacterium]